MTMIPERGPFCTISSTNSPWFAYSMMLRAISETAVKISVLSPGDKRDAQIF